MNVDDEMTVGEKHYVGFLLAVFLVTMSFVYDMANVERERIEVVSNE